MIKREFLKPNKAKIKTFIAVLLLAGMCFLIVGNAFGKSLSSSLLWGPSPKTEIYQIIAIIFSLVLFLPTLLMWMLTYNLIKVFGIILGFVLNLGYWYYLACAIYSFKERRKRTLAP